MKQSYKPGPGWSQNGRVYDHVSGLRLHPIGMVRLASGDIIDGTQWPETMVVSRFVRIAGGRRRGLMCWAISFLGKDGE